MIKSMTGFGRAQQLLHDREITIEIKAVNHRFVEFNVYGCRQYGILEEKLKTLLRQKISRGKVDVGVSIVKMPSQGQQVVVDQVLAQQYIQGLRKINETLLLKDDLALSDLIRFPELFSIQYPKEDENQLYNDVQQVAHEALEMFLEMRCFEGQRLKQDLSEKCLLILDIMSKIQKQAPLTQQAYEKRLLERLKKTLETQYERVDQQRVVTEVAIYAERIATDEEIVRLHSHLQQFLSLLNSSQPIGRKMDFLAQELNREINCISSKAQDLFITKLALDVKAEIEKIREQIQNIE